MTCPMVATIPAASDEWKNHSRRYWVGQTTSSGAGSPASGITSGAARSRSRPQVHQPQRAPPISAAKLAALGISSP